MQLQNLINPQLFLEVKNNEVSIVETNNAENDKLYEVIIEKLPANVIAFSTDKNLAEEKNKIDKLCNQFLNRENERINKNCDGILIYQDQQDLYVIICELKSEHPKPKYYERQMMNGKLLVEYLVNLFNELYEGEEAKLNIKKVYFALFYKQRASDNKSETRLKANKPMIEPMKIFVNEQIRKVGFSKSHKNPISWHYLTIEQIN